MAFTVFSEEPIQKKYIQIADYIDGYGIGESPQHELDGLLEAMNAMRGLKIRIRR